MALPQWVTTELFETSLASHFQDSSIKVLDFTCKMATPTGENYTTDVFRATIRYTSKLTNNGNICTVSVIVKCTHEGGLLESLAKEINLFDKELDMFSNILPRMNKVHGRLGTFSAGCLKYIEKPLQTLLLEDLCPMGYNVHERRHGLDLEHTLAILRILAGFHSSSAIMLDEDPDALSDIYQSGLFPDKEVSIGWMTTGYIALKDCINRWPEFERYRHQLTISPKTFVRRALDTMSRNQGDFIVLNHGDMWVNNMMFTYDTDGRIKGCKLIDYQLSIKCSPVIDLHYFFCTSLADELREDIDYLLDYYYGHLLATLTELRYPLSRAPTRREFLDDFKKRAYYGLLSIVTVMPLVRSEGRDDSSFEDLFFNDKETGFRYHAFNNEQYKLGLKHILPYYEALGVLE